MNKSKQISLGAMVTVFSILFMFMTSILPTVEVFLLCLSSYLISILIIEADKPTATLSFLATAVLGAFLVPNKLMIIAYIGFFGYYGILKSYIERLNNLILEWVIKILIFNLIVLANYFVFVKLFADNLQLPFSLGLVVLVLQVGFGVYDYVFSMFIDYYHKRLRKLIK